MYTGPAYRQSVSQSSALSSALATLRFIGAHYGYYSRSRLTLTLCEGLSSTRVPDWRVRRAHACVAAHAAPLRRDRAARARQRRFAHGVSRLLGRAAAPP